MNAELITSTAGVLLSLGFSYVPGLKEGWGSLSGEQKRLIMLLILILVTLIPFALVCAGWGDFLGLPGLACDQFSAADLFRALLAAVMANQATFAISPRAPAAPQAPKYDASIFRS